MTNIGGNYYDKYGTSNPIAQYLMNGFFSTFDSLAHNIQKGQAIEVGCGEGYLTRRLSLNGWQCTGFDVESEMVSLAKRVNADLDVSPTFYQSSIYNIQENEFRKYDLVVCCEVLEHLEDPKLGLKCLKASGATNFILSVPREPIWRIMNMARLKYLGDFGNTPGHLNHWSTIGFKNFVQQEFNIREILTPLPWTFLYATSK